LLIIGVLVGIYIYIRQPSLVKASIINELKSLEDILKNSKQNNFLYHIIVLSISAFLSTFVIGIPIIIFYLFYEGLSIGFLLASFINYKKISGLLFGTVFFIINKLLLLSIIIYLLIVSINYSKKIIINIKNKDYRISEHLLNHLIKMIFVFIIVMTYDIFIYFLGNRILTYFIFLL
ncbi:MAG: hypothetical protein GX265_03320, partial [Mollicutes bacterium]|nr:hypothetical protein [Mollicutes bacterium]